MSAYTVDLMINIFLLSASLPFIFGLYAWFYSWKLMHCIKQRDPYRYQYLWGNTFAGFGDPFTNFLVVWRYLYSDEDEEKDEIRTYKNKLRTSIKYFLITILIVGFIGSLMMIIGYYDESNVIGTLATF